MTTQTTWVHWYTIYQRNQSLFLRLLMFPIYCEPLHLPYSNANLHHLWPTIFILALNDRCQLTNNKVCNSVQL